MWQISVYVSNTVNLEGTHETEEIKAERISASPSEWALQGLTWRTQRALVGPLYFHLPLREGSGPRPNPKTAVDKKLAIKEFWNKISADSLHILYYDTV